VQLNPIKLDVLCVVYPGRKELDLVQILSRYRYIDDILWSECPSNFEHGDPSDYTEQQRKLSDIAMH
jgi:hypothetical protein